MFQVYFDYKNAGDDLLLGIVVKDGQSTVLQENKLVPKEEGLTNYEYSLEAWRWAMERTVEEDYDQVTFYNQNQLLFTWAVKGTYSDVRKPYYDDILPKLHGMIEEGYHVGFEVVVGTKNLAKKYIQRIGKNVSVAGSFNSLFAQAKSGQFTKNQVQEKRKEKAKVKEKQTGQAKQTKKVLNLGSRLKAK
ncbi:hypothetical protein [Bacillus thuringiensis]|uniref:hypothetical protein n=1 Tax=Bacillus thuringiensis TaxID=1428 RepID=UPI000BFDC90D|nr:hypothetical protein [Bacillus thuringiensis]PGT89828.1 hypothetical protein COD17_08755 [Bacillus thuringiensis]